MIFKYHEKCMDNITLILEGGALRSVYTAGVLDTLMENNIEAQTVIGVSAGALSGLNYLSKQIGRTAKINIEYSNDPNYMGRKALSKEKDLIGFNYLFEDVSKKVSPFDYETFKKSKQEFIAAVANCKTAETEFMSKSDSEDIFKVVQASSTLPLSSKMVEIEGKQYLDGSVTDAIPVEWAIEQGFKNIVVVLTRDRDYRKNEISKMMKNVYKRVYKQYPKIIDKLCTVPERYNQTKELLNKLEDEGKILVIRPQKTVNVSRLEKDKIKLENLYQDGKKDAEDKLDYIKDLIKNNRKGSSANNNLEEISLYEEVMKKTNIKKFIIEPEDKESTEIEKKDGIDLLQENVRTLNNQKIKKVIKGVKRF